MNTSIFEGIFDQKLQSILFFNFLKIYNFNMEQCQDKNEIYKQKNLAKQRSCLNQFTSKIMQSFIKIHKKTSVTSQAGSIARQILNFIISLQCFISLLLISDNSIALEISQLILSIQNQNTLYLLFQIILLIVNCILMIAILTSSHTRLNPILEIIRVNIIQNFRLLAYSNFIPITLLLYVNFLQNIHLLFIGTVILLFSILVAENYYLKQNNNYQTDAVRSLKHTILLVFIATINAFILYLQNQFCYYLFNIIVSSLLIIWHLDGGATLYSSKNLSFSLILIDSVIVTVGISCLTRLISLSTMVHSKIVECIILFVFTSVFLIQNRQDKQNNLVIVKAGQKYTNIKDFQVQITQILQDCENSIELQSIITGQLSCQAEKQSLNPQYFLNQSQLYIPSSKSYFKPTSLVKQKSYLFIYFLKSIYQESIKTKQNTKTKLDYCEFMINYFEDSSVFYHLIELQNQSDLGIIDKIKIINLKLILQQKSQALNKQLFGGRVQLLSVLKAQKTYQQISLKINIFCNHNVKIWQNLLNGKIKQSQFKLGVKKNYQNIKIIDEKWKELAVFFHLQKLWKSIYLSYSFFIKNEKLKKNQVSFQQSLTQMYPTNQSKKLNFQTCIKTFFNSKINDLFFFEQNTALFSTELRQNQLYFLHTSKRFKQLFNFSNDQIKGNPLSTVIPLRHRQAHRKGFLNWLRNGQSVDEKNYRVKFSQILTKDGSEKPVCILYKIYINLAQIENAVSFVGLLNSIKKDIQMGSQFLISQLSLSNKLPQRQAQTQKLSHSFSINVIKNEGKNNIFIKEDQLQPVSIHNNIRSIKKTIRIISIFSIIFTLISLFLFLQKVNHVKQTIGETYFFINSYRCPMGLMTNYIRLTLDIGNPTKLKNQIKTFNGLMYNISTNRTIIKILSDQFLNEPALYYPYISNQINKGIAYDQIDIFYVVYSSLTSMGKSQTVNRSSQDFILLNNYLMPAYDNMVNGTKMNFYQRMLILVDNISKMQLFFIVSFTFIYFLVVIYILNKTESYYKNMQQFFLILAQGDKTSLLQAKRYWQFLKNHFTKFSQQEVYSQGLDQTKNKSSKLIKQFQQVLNSSDLQIIGGRGKNNLQMDQKKCNFFDSIIKIILLMLLLLFLIANPIINITQMQSFKIKMEQGHDVLWHYPNLQLVSYALADRYYSLVYPNQTTYNFTRFETCLSNFNMMAQHVYISEADTKSLFLQKAKNYRFGNPCAFNPSIHQAAGYSLKECESFGNNTLQNGITTFVSYLQPQINNFLSPNSNLMKYQKKYITELASSLSLGAAYFTDILQSWLKELQTNMDNFQAVNKYSALAICLGVLFIHLAILEWNFLGTLEGHYEQMRRIYLNFVPCPTIHKQKLTKQKLYNTGILNFPGNC